VAGGQAEESMSAALHKVVHEVLGDDLTLSEAQQMLAEVDAKNDGKISLSEVSLPEGPIYGSMSHSSAIACDPLNIRGPVWMLV